MFAKLLSILLASVASVGADIDNAIMEYRADPNNAAKAHTVAKAVLGVVDTVAPIIAATQK